MTLHDKSTHFRGRGENLVGRSISLIVILLTCANITFAQTTLQRSVLANNTEYGGVSAGVAFGDYDNDGYIDLYVTNNANNMNDPNQKSFLFKNNGDGTFEKIEDGPTVSFSGYSSGAVWGDYDNDGFLDLFVTRQINQHNLLFHNNGNGTFTQIKEGDIVNDYGDSYSAIWVDTDNDGWLDLFVANSGNQPNFYYRNLGNGNFEPVRDDVISSERGTSYSAVFGDYDNDGDQDLFVPTRGKAVNALYMNNGDGSFTKVTDSPVVTDQLNSSSGSFVDYDNDGDLDLFVANGGFFYAGENNSLYENNGEGEFKKITDQPFVNDSSQSQSGVWADFDNDADLDLYVTTYLSPDKMYLNNGDKTFTEVTQGFIVYPPSFSTGTGAGDIDNDGDLELYVANWDNQNNFYFINNSSGNNWFKIICEGNESNRNGIGARVVLTALVQGKEIHQVREINTCIGFRSQSDLTAHFGLGDAAVIKSIRINWPSGRIDELTELEPNQYVRIKEGKGIIEKYPGKEIQLHSQPSIVQYINDNLEKMELNKLFEIVYKFYEEKKYSFSPAQINALGYQLVSQGKSSAALEVFKMNNKLNPLNANSYDSLAEFYMGIGEYEKAKELYDKMLEVIPNDPSMSSYTREYLTNNAKYYMKHILKK